MGRVLVIILLSLASGEAFASYRVYVLKVTHYDFRGRIVRSRFVQSTLDHLQWEHYHGAYGNARVELVDTWYCPGDTSRRAYCEKPRLKPTRGPASTDPKRPGLSYGRQPIIP